MPDLNIKKLLESYHQGLCTPEEEARLFEVLRSRSHEKEVAKAMEEILETTSINSPLGFDKELIFGNIRDRIGEQQAVKGSAVPARRLISLVAAAVGLILLSAYFILNFETGKENLLAGSSATEYRIFETGKGQFRTVILPDGSTVRLNTSSSIRIETGYSSSPERVVFLEGEAFFDVTRNEKKPFKVFAGDIEVAVLGTSFNVNSHYNGGTVKVAVASGRVKVENASRNNQVFLEKDQMVTIQDNQFLKLSGIDRLQEFGWTEQILVFSHASFEEVVDKLENWYGVTFVTAEGQPLDEWNYTASFDKQNLEKVLMSISFVKDFDYEIRNDSVLVKF